MVQRGRLLAAAVPLYCPIHVLLIIKLFILTLVSHHVFRVIHYLFKFFLLLLVYKLGLLLIGFIG